MATIHIKEAGAFLCESRDLDARYWPVDVVHGWPDLKGVLRLMSGHCGRCAEVYHERYPRRREPVEEAA